MVLTGQNTPFFPDQIWLMQITRQRVRPDQRNPNWWRCPTCDGTGKIGPTLIDETSKESRFYVKEKKIREFILRTVLILAAYIHKRIVEHSLQMEQKV